MWRFTREREKSRETRVESPEPEWLQLSTLDSQLWTFPAMSTKRSAQLDATFQALADPTRRAILARVSRGERNVSELAEPFDMSLAAVSKHLKVLERAGLLSRKQLGRVHNLRLEAGPLKEAAMWISFYQKFWGRQLDSLGEFLKTVDAEKTTSKMKRKSRDGS